MSKSVYASFASLSSFACVFGFNSGGCGCRFVWMKVYAICAGLVVLGVLLYLGQLETM